MRHVLIVFCALVLSLPAAAKSKPTKGLRYPSLTPDGKRVVFCYRGDIWVAGIEGGHAERLTIHEEQDTLCRVSPDGKQIAFSSKRNGNYDLYVMPIEGGIPKQVTFHTGPEILCSWHPDGKKLLFMSNRDMDMGRLDLYEAALDGGTPRRITYDGAREGSYNKDGSKIVYVRGFHNIYWDNYKGSANYDIHVIDAQGGTPRRVTDTPENERWPYFSADGQTIYFVTEQKGVANFYSIPFAGGKRTQLTTYEKNDVHRPDVNWDLKTVVFEIVGQLYWTDLGAPAKKPTPIELDIQSDMRNSGIEIRTITSGGEQVHLSPDGRRAAFTLRGDIWVMPAHGGDAERLTSGPHNDQWPRFSPDGKSIAFFTDRTGNHDIFLIDLKTKRTRQLTRHRAHDHFHNWSPDGRKLVFCSERSGNKDIWTLDLDSNQLTPLTKHATNDDDPCFSPDGTKVAFDSGRDGAQAIYVMDADGKNVRRVSQASADHYQVPCFSPDGAMLVFEAYVPGSPVSGGLFVAPATGGAAMAISSDGATACWSPTGDYIYFTANRGGTNNGVFRVKAPESVVQGERVPFVGRVEVDRRKELEQLFDQAWTSLKNGFYDRRMHKVDWNQLRTKYRDMAIDAENKDEFHNIVRQMLAELGASHLGIGGGVRDTSVTPRQKETGHLGLDFEQTHLEDGAQRILHVLPGGPADAAGLRRGDVVTKIHGKRLKPSLNLDEVLAGTVGNAVKVAYKPLSAGGLGPERSTDVTPVGLPRLRILKQKEWVASCKRRVEAKETKGTELAYIHLNAMNPPNLIRFQQAVQRWNKKRKVKGMILDVRNNGGGNIHQQLMRVFFARPLAEVRPRGMERVIQPGLYWDKPVVLLINERSFSDAEVFPYMFKEAGIGTVVGVPTPGGVIGTNDITLSDGSTFRIPRTGFYGLDGTNLEGLGVEPDVLVEETAEDRLAGRDPQLDRALEILLKEIEGKAKAKKPVVEAKQEEPKPQPEVAPAPEKEPKPETVPAGVDPLKDARVGEWVRYRVINPANGDETMLKVRVTGVKDGVVTFEKEIEKGPPTLPPLPERLQQIPALEALGAFGQLKEHTVVQAEIKGVQAEVLFASIVWPDGSLLRLAMTESIPAYGLWKVELDKRVILEAIEWGVPEGKETVGRAAAKPAPEQAAPETPAADPADTTPPHPMRDVKVGEWIRMRQHGPNDMSMEVTQRVAEVTEDEIVLDATFEFGGRSVERTMRQERRLKLEPPDRLENVKYGKETLTLEGKAYDCIVLTARAPNGAEVRYFFCEKIPVTGLVKIERDGVVVAEAVGWGFEEE